MTSLESTIAVSSAPTPVPPKPKEAETGPNEDPTGLIEEHILPRLDPAFVKYFLDVIAKAPPGDKILIQDVRANPEKYRSPWAIDTSGHRGVSDERVTSEDGTQFTVRLYYPDFDKFRTGGYTGCPVHINFHGGGFVTGDLMVEAQLCLNMREAGVAVVDVDYRLCPENIWGKAVQDAWATLNWIRSSSDKLGIDSNSISIGGVSAGGHISLILQHMARDAGIPLKLCMPTVPPSTEGLAYKYYTDSPFPSFHEFHRAPILPWKRIQYFGKHCFPDDKLEEIKAMWPEWWIAPIKAPNWNGLCDTFLRTAEIDPLRDEGEAYGMKLVGGGNKVTFKRYLGSPHTFMYMKFLESKREFDEDSVKALRVAHGITIG
ncbi:Alpha/Beta hydrolase protein [Apodospora peruviana]|uniref:Alpha/Beta hydrolase protein n=1 Tax=Apodospora peruviana TaxID=516989 RepID=A0AAE0I2H8_9PEZI|nr:Alpha/Beta hydrolase protein [Apodospora peruviana]